jgi:hypothetical protein
VSGEQPDLLVIEADSTGTVASFVRTLDALPREPRWVLVGGFAVNLRISTLHRLTGDVDTLTSAHREFLELPVGREDVEQLAASKGIRLLGPLREGRRDGIDYRRRATDKACISSLQS